MLFEVTLGIIKLMTTAPLTEQYSSIALAYDGGSPQNLWWKINTPWFHFVLDLVD